jgi:hypothetical protein
MNAQNKEEIEKAGALQMLIELLNCPIEEVQEHSAVCIQNLSVNANNKIRIVQEGGLPPLIELLRSKNKKVQEQSVVPFAI